MKKWVLWCATMVLVGQASTPGVAAPAGFQWRGSGGWGAGLPYGRLFDSGQVVTLRGEVLWVKKLTAGEGMADGLQLLLKSRDETLPVHLGPVWYLERQDLPLVPGDTLEVTGARVLFEGMPVLLACEVKKGGNVLMLRERSGFPLWSGWRRR